MGFNSGFKGCILKFLSVKYSTLAVYGNYLLFLPDPNFDPGAPYLSVPADIIAS